MFGRKRRRQAYGSAHLPGAQRVRAGAPVRPEDIPREVLGLPPFPDRPDRSLLPPLPERTFDDWWAEGRARGYVSEPFCAMHHTEVMSPAERETFEAGFDPCTPGTVRVWPLAGRGDGGHD